MYRVPILYDNTNVFRAVYSLSGTIYHELPEIQEWMDSNISGDWDTLESIHKTVQVKIKPGDQIRSSTIIIGVVFSFAVKHEALLFKMACS